MAKRYLLDTNIFIRSKNELPMDIYPSFWSALLELANKGIFVSSEEVRKEILKGDDELTELVKEKLPNDFFIPIDDDILKKYSEVQNWARRMEYYTVSALATFADVADAFLIATAASKSITLITYEKSNPLSKKRIMIPDACMAIGAEFCELNMAFRDLGIKI